MEVRETTVYLSLTQRPQPPPYINISVRAAGGLALLRAALGLYGVTAYGVGRRRTPYCWLAGPVRQPPSTRSQ
jgi:hypothetical protein